MHLVMQVIQSLLAALPVSAVCQRAGAGLELTNFCVRTANLLQECTSWLCPWANAGACCTACFAFISLCVWPAVAAAAAVAEPAKPAPMAVDEEEDEFAGMD